MKDLISVIVPIYNVEEYLERCLDSIINQTYKNLEIVLIDDGSTDKSGVICDKYKKRDKRIKVYHKKNSGVSEARNDGIKLSTGKYLFFLDSDDYVDLDIIEFLYKSINISKKIDIAYCMYSVVYDNNITKKDKNEYYLYDSQGALDNLLYNKNSCVNVVAKLYKRDLFNNITFPNYNYGEDLAVTYKLFAKSRMIICNTIHKYYYFQRNNSATHSKFTVDRMSGLEIVLEQTKFIKENFPLLVGGAINREFMEGIYIILKIPFTNEFKKEIDVVRKIIYKNRKIVLFDKKSTLITRIYALFSYFGLKNMIRFHKVYTKIRR